MVQKQPTRRATITDVAHAADVSIKTVSRVFNQEANVRPETRERVMTAARTLDYHPNPAARSLAGRRSYLIGFAYRDSSPHYIRDLQRGVAGRLVDEAYRLLVLPCAEEGDGLRRMGSIGRAAGLDGLILAPPLGDDPEVVASLVEHDLPFVRIDPSRRHHAAPAVAMDDVAAVHEVVAFLAELGHRRIAIVSGDPAHAASRARTLAFRKAMLAHGLDVDPDLERPGDFRFHSGLEAGRALLALPEPPTAVFASNDDMAAGVVSAAHEAGVPVPARLSVVGFDDSVIAEVVWPRLTTIHQPTEEMARVATDALLAILDERPTPEHVVLPHRLVVRGSSGPVPGSTARLQPLRARTGHGPRPVPRGGASRTGA